MQRQWLCSIQSAEARSSCLVIEINTSAVRLLHIAYNKPFHPKTYTSCIEGLGQSMKP